MGFDPITIAAMTAIKMVSTLASANAQAEGLKSQAAVQNANAGIMDASAQAIREQTVAQEGVQRREARQVLGAQAAGFAQAGGGMEGSAHDVMEQSAVLAELDALNIRYGGELKAKGLTDEATISRFEAKTYKAAARKTLKLGYLGAGADILGGAAAYGQYGSYQKLLKANKTAALSGAY